MQSTDHRHQIIFTEDWPALVGIPVCALAIVLILAARLFWGFERLEFLNLPVWVILLLGGGLWGISRVPCCPKCTARMHRMPSTPQQNRVHLCCMHCGYEKLGACLWRGALTKRPFHDGFLGNEMLDHVEHQKRKVSERPGKREGGNDKGDS